MAIAAHPQRSSFVLRSSLTDSDLVFRGNSGMTTENNPAGVPAEDSENHRRALSGDSPVEEQASAEEVRPAAAAEDQGGSTAGFTEGVVDVTAADVSSQNTPVESPSHQQTSFDGPPEDPSVADESGSVPPPQADSQAAPESPPSKSAISSSVSESLPPPRRARLNPTADPEALKPIPSVRSTDPPPDVAAPARSSADESESDAADAGESSDSVPTANVTPATEERDKGEMAEVATDQPAVEPAAPPPPPTDPIAIPPKNESLDADLEAELEAAMAGAEQSSGAIASTEDAEREAAATEPNPDIEIKRGTRLQGTVQSIHGDDMFVEFGLRMAGVLSRRQFGLRKQPMQGEPLEVVVHRVDEKEGLIHVNLPTGISKVRGEWDALTVDQIVECLVHGTNKGGLEVTVGALRGFLPASQVELGYVPDLNVYIGQKLRARVAEVNPKRRKLVLSRRSILEEEREQSQQELFEKVQPGQQYTGRVKTIKDYGAFIDIGGADGLLHVAQISWTRINHPSEVLKEGEEVEVQVLSVDKEKKKISLGMRQLTQNPWKLAESKYAQGAQVKGKVTRIENFGAFIELEEGVEGLVHISELDHKRVKKVTEVLQLGQEVDVQVLEVDPKRKRVALSLKALKEKPAEREEGPPSEPIKRQRSVDSLVGGMGEPTGGQLFGDPSKFGR